MRRTFARVAFLALVVSAAAAPAAASELRARVAVVDLTPVRVVGSGFRGREHVRVRVTSSDGSFAKTVVATTSGRFTASFPGREIEGCAGYSVSAAGSRGSRATARKIDPPPPCGVVIIP